MKRIINLTLSPEQQVYAEEARQKIAEVESLLPKTGSTSVTANESSPLFITRRSRGCQDGTASLNF